MRQACPPAVRPTEPTRRPSRSAALPTGRFGGPRSGPSTISPWLAARPEVAKSLRRECLDRKRSAHHPLLRGTVENSARTITAWIMRMPPSPTMRFFLPMGQTLWQSLLLSPARRRSQSRDPERFSDWHLAHRSARHRLAPRGPDPRRPRQQRRCIPGRAPAFVDGNEVTGYTDGAATIAVNTVPNTGTGRLAFGNNLHAGTSSGFGGSLDDIQIYDQALTPSQISSLFLNPGSVIPEPSSLGLLLTGLVICLRRVAHSRGTTS